MTYQSTLPGKQPCNPENFLEEARGALRKPPKKMKCSSIWKSSTAWNGPTDYLNQLVCGITQFKAEELLMEAKPLKNVLGVSVTSVGDRGPLISTSFLMAKTIDSPILKIPHPDGEACFQVDASPKLVRNDLSGSVIRLMSLEDWKINSSEPLPVIFSS